MREGSREKGEGEGVGRVEVNEEAVKGQRDLGRERRSLKERRRRMMKGEGE